MSSVVTPDQARYLLDRMEVVVRDWDTPVIIGIAYDHPDEGSKFAVSHNCACGHGLSEFIAELAEMAVDKGCNYSDHDKDDPDAMEDFGS